MDYKPRRFLAASIFKNKNKKFKRLKKDKMFIPIAIRKDLIFLYILR